MLQKKVCLLGAFSVGKTSLIQRYVNKQFSDRYLTTVGVRIDKKQVSVGSTDLNLMVWDIAGEDDFTNIRSAHLRGLSGYVVVIDVTRQNSFNVAISLHERIKAELGDVAAVFALNKCDLKDQWVLSRDHIRTLVQLGHPVIETSAKLDQGVEEMFMGLARQLVPVKTEA